MVKSNLFGVWIFFSNLLSMFVWEIYFYTHFASDKNDDDENADDGDDDDHDDDGDDDIDDVDDDVDSVDGEMNPFLRYTHNTKLGVVLPSCCSAHRNENHFDLSGRLIKTCFVRYLVA